MKKELLPEKPNSAELVELGNALIVALETSTISDASDLVEELNSPAFKPFSSKHYVANWYRKEKTNTLYCGIFAGSSIRFHFEVCFIKEEGSWVCPEPVSKSVILK